MKVKVYNREFEAKILYNEYDNTYLIKILDGSNVMGYASFKVKRRQYQDSIWLYKIETNPNYAHMGVGTATICLLEYFALNKRVQVIEGKYFPKNEFAKPFYEKYGYSIEKDGYETFIFKYLDYKKIKENIEPKIIQYEEQIGSQNELNI